MPGQQPNLFDTELPEWELDAQADVCVATVVLPSGFARELDYRVPDQLRDAIEPGRRVQVPLGRGNRKVTAYCVAVETHNRTAHKLKDVSEVIDARRLLSPGMLRLTRWMADYYLCPWGQVLETVVPAGVRGGAGTRLTTLLHVPTDVAAQHTKLKLPAKQAAALKHLLGQPGPMTPSDLAAAVGCTRAPITALLRKNLITSETRRLRGTAPTNEIFPTESHLTLNDHQRAALQTITDSIQSRKHETVLIHGVTGSGKTEVYIQAIQQVVSFGRQAIVLVPEISLTPQTVSRFESRFGRVAVLHSHLSNVQRHQQWELIADGSVSVIVGARSAVFAPAPHLGLIVIDEEHESSFKQGTAPRYHAREVAQRRAAEEGIPLVLGSATPSLESFQRAQQGDYRLVRMPKRVFDRPLPSVATIDLRSHDRDRWTQGAISRQLQTAMKTSLEDGGQVILLLNRRGFSTHIQCPSCGEAVVCPHCEIAMTHHKQRQLAICHYCDFQRPVPDRCPECNFAGIRFSGRGTQRLEEEVRARFADFKCLRMDTDAMKRPGSHEAALARFRDGEVQILLGTQMIAKGLDFPNVTLVGVINADTALHLPDFRAAERTFQLVTQVAGRTGRSERGGHVLVQTCEPDHIAIQAAIRHDFDFFAAHEMPMRKALGYPPFGTMIRMVVRGPQENTAREFTSQIADCIRAACPAEGPAVKILGPAPAPFAKLRGKYRFAIQLQSPDGDRLIEVVRAATEQLKPPDDVQWIADVDPMEMM